MGSAARTVCAAIALLLLLAAGPARADHVILQNGNLVEGEVSVDEAAGVVIVRRGGATLSFPMAEVRKIVEADGPASDDPAPAPGPVEAAVIPLHGSLTHFRARQEFDRVLEEALALRPKVILLEIGSPGGLTAVGQHLAKRLLAVEGPRTVALLRGPEGGAHSAAALVALACEAIFMAPGQSIGAAVPFRQMPSGTPAAVTAKFASRWRADFRAVAEQRGHAPELAEAMVGVEGGLAEVAAAGKRAFVPAVGMEPSEDPEYRVTILCAPGEVLTLTSEEAERCGLARAVVPDAARVLRGYRIEPAAAQVLSDPLVSARKVVGREQDRLERDLAELTELTERLLQRNPSNGRYEVDPKTGEFQDGGAEWRRRTRECLRNVRKSLKTIEEIRARLTREPDLRADLQWIARLERDLVQFDAELQRFRQLTAPPR